MELSDSDRNRTYCWVEGSLKKRAELLILFLEEKFKRFISEELRMFRSWPNDFQNEGLQKSGVRVVNSPGEEMKGDDYFISNFTCL